MVVFTNVVWWGGGADMKMGGEEAGKWQRGEGGASVSVPDAMG